MQTVGAILNVPMGGHLSEYTTGDQELDRHG